MGLSYSNPASNTLNNKENYVINNKQDDLTGHSTYASSGTKFKTVPSKPKSKLDVCKLNGPVVRVPSINSPDFKLLENSLFFQLLLDRYLKLLGRNEPFMQLKMTKSNSFPHIKTVNDLENSDNITNTCSKTVKDGMLARKVFKFIRLHQAQKQILNGSEYATNAPANNVEEIKKKQKKDSKLKFGFNENVSGDDKKDKTKVSTKNKSSRLSRNVKYVTESSNTTFSVFTSDETVDRKFNKIVLEEMGKPTKDEKTLEGHTKRCVNNEDNKQKENVEGKRKKRKLRRFNRNPPEEEKKPTKEETGKYHLKTLEGQKKQSINNKDRLGNDAIEAKPQSGRKIKAVIPFFKEMAEDTSKESDNANKVTKISVFKLEKNKNSRNIPIELTTAAPKKKVQRKFNKEIEIPAKNSVLDQPTLENNIKGLPKTRKLIKAASYTGVSVTSGSTDITQTVFKMPTNIPHQHMQPIAEVREESLNSAKKANSKLLVMEKPVTPTKSHLKSPRVLTKMNLEAYTTKILGTEEKHSKTAISMEAVLKTMECPRNPIGKIKECFGTSVGSVLKNNLESIAEKSENIANTMEKANLPKEIQKFKTETASQIPIRRSEISRQENIQPITTKPKSPIQSVLNIFADRLETLTKTNLNTCMAELPTTVETSKTHIESKFDKIMERPKTPNKSKMHEVLDTPLQFRNTTNDLANSSRETAKACIKYSRTAQHALSILNNEVSSVLRESLCSIDDIKFRVCTTMEEIKAADKLYQRLKAQQQKLASHSTPHLSEPDQSINEPNTNDLLHALSCGLVQTQSENQLRLALLSNTNENASETTTCVHEIDDSPLEMPPLAYPVVNYEAEMEPKPPILPKIVPIVEVIDQPCTTLKQQKIDIFNIPPCIPFTPAVGQTTRKIATSKDKVVHSMRRQSISYSIKRPSSPFSKICSKKFMNRDLTPEIKLRLKEIAIRLGLDDLPRSRAQPDLYHKLIKEFVATDSLIEFQRQMKHVNQVKDANEGTAENAAKEVNEAKASNDLKGIKKNKVVQIMAEELYVPDRKINKIAATNLTSSTLKNRTAPRLKPKCCQFLYREKRKKRSNLSIIKGRKELDNNSSNTIQLSKTISSRTNKQTNDEKQSKYADSLWFCSHSKKDTKQSIEKPSKQPISIMNSDAVIRCDSKKSNIIVDNAAQTQTDDTSSNKAYWPQLNLQSTNCKSGLDCFDILDEISLRDIKPLESEYPRRDHIGSEPFYTQAENTYLYKLVYGSTQEQFMQLLSIQEPTLHCTTANCQTCGVTQKTTEMCSKRKTNEDILDKSKKGDGYQGKHENFKTENKRKPNQRSFSFLYNHSTTGSSRSTVASCKNTASARATSKNSKQRQYLSNGKGEKKRSASLNTKYEVGTNNKTLEQIKPKVKKTKKNNQDVASKLLPYIFDPKMRYPTTITVMPITVTTYTNPNFTQRNKSVVKDHSGDFSPSKQNNLENKIEPKPVNKSTKVPPKPSTTSDKKIWGTKYAKSPSINLISYLEKQNSDYPSQTFGDICNDNFYPNPKNVFVSTPTKLGKKYVPVHPPSFHANTLRTHSQPHYSVKGSTVKNLDKTPTKLVTPRSTHPKQVVETPKTQKIPEKTTLENDIQNVIEMIEGKIIDLVSSPDNLPSEAFSSVEKEIVEILKAMQTEKPLDAINEASDIKGNNGPQHKKKNKKSKLHSKTSSHLQKPLGTNKILGAQTNPELVDPLTISELLTSESIPPEIFSVELEHKSSNEESFEITSSYAPMQTPRIKTGQQVNPTRIDIEVPEKLDMKNQISENCRSYHYSTLQKTHTEPKIIKNIQLNSSKNELQISQTEPKINTYNYNTDIENLPKTKSLVEKLQETQYTPIIIKETPELDNLSSSLEKIQKHSIIIKAVPESKNLLNLEKIQKNSNIIKAVPESENLNLEETQKNSNIIKAVPELENHNLEETQKNSNIMKAVPESENLLNLITVSSKTTSKENLQEIPEHDDMVNNLYKKQESDGDMQTNSDEQIQIIKSISSIDTSNSEKTPVKETRENSQQVTDLIPVETAPAVEVRSEEFLTPFMHALKHYRQDDHSPSSCNILEFLDTLTNISDEFSSKTITGCQLSTVHYKHKIQVASVLHEPEIFYPIVIWEPITMLPGSNTKLNAMFQSEIISKSITDELQRARTLFSSLNLSRVIGFASVPPPIVHQIYPKNTDLMCCCTDEIDPCVSKQSTFKQRSLKALCDITENHSETKPMQPSILNKTYDKDHGRFLNTVYGMLFSAVFLSLTFNYTCQ